MSGKHFSKLEIQWLKDNFCRFGTYKELHQEFVKMFRPRTMGSLMDLCSKRLHLHRGKNNQGQYGIREKGQLPIGTERVAQGIVYVKVMDGPKSTKISGYKPPYWLPKQRKIYEDVHGQIPNGCFVIFLDKNTKNYNIDNLYCLGRNIHSTMCKNRWYTTDRNITLTAIKYLELMQALKGRTP